MTHFRRKPKRKSLQPWGREIIPRENTENIKHGRKIDMLDLFRTENFY